MIACMGGFCNSRDKCANYYSDNSIISERICGEIEEVEYLPRDNKENEKNLEERK
jgi:hypothetical protein